MSAEDLAGRVVVITGAASGIGRATALAFSSLGATLIAIDQDGDGNASLRDDIRARGGLVEDFVADVADRAAVRSIAEQIIEKYPAIHLLFNNAGMTQWVSLEGTDDETWDRLIAVNLTSAVVCSRAFLPALKRAGRASIVHNSSIDGILGNPRIPAYSSAKGGLTPLTHVMAEELAQFGIRVNCVAPGGIGGTAVSSIAALPPEYPARLSAATPLRRWGTPEEVAAVVVFLASDAASYVNGVVIPVDGGRTGLTPATI